MAKYRVTRPVWAGGSEQIGIGTIVEFDDEPTGVYRGRCAPVAEEKPKTLSRAEAKAKAEAEAGGPPPPPPTK